MVAMGHVDRSDVAETALEALRWATAAGILHDKLHKAGGPAQTFVITPEFLESEIARLEEELGKVAPDNPRSIRQMDEEDIDRALRQSLVEIERKMRADYERQQTGRDRLGRVVPMNGQTPPETDL